LQSREFQAAGGAGRSLDAYVRWSQRRQKIGLAVALDACLRKFPRCGGFILWMGHDAFPMPCNTSILDFHGRPKPAAFAIRDILLAANQSF
jgi:beta-mannosidase